MSSTLNFNDLPDEIRHMTFDLFTPVERTLVSPTCKSFYDLIMETKAWWRECEIESEVSMEKIKEILKFFSIKSHNTLTSIKIEKTISTKAELEEIFSLLKSSSSSIKKLILLQSSSLNSKTREFAQKLPQLQILVSQSGLSEDRWKLDPTVTGLRVFGTGKLQNVKAKEMIWLSQLTYLSIGSVEWGDPDFLTVLRSCQSNLEHLNLVYFPSSTNSTFTLAAPLQMDALLSLHPLSFPISEPELILPITAPSLRRLSGRIDQVRAVTAAAVETLELILEDETEEGWNAEEVLEFTEKIKACLVEKSHIKHLRLSGDKHNFRNQLKALVGLLTISYSGDHQVLCPHLKSISIFECSQLESLQDLARLFIRRFKFRLGIAGRDKFRIFLDDPDEKLRTEVCDRLNEAVEQLEMFEEEEEMEDYFHQ